jgi:hypothetical protein
MGAVIRALGLIVVAWALTGCGGSDAGSAGADSIATPGADEIAAAPCARCRSGFVTGVAADGGVALADAPVRLSDGAGRTAHGRTDANGRFELPLGALTAPLLVRVTAGVAGEPVRLHGALRHGEAGRQYVAVTPVSELIVADALGGVPEQLERAGRLDVNRLAGDALPQAAQRVRSRLAPVLDAAGVEPALDPRTALFDAPATASSAAGFARALAWLQVAVAGGGYDVRHAAMAAGSGVRFDATGGDGATPLPPLTAESAAQLQAATTGLAQVEQLLRTLGDAFAVALPDAAVLRGYLAADFHHRGLDRDGYVDRVLRRADAADVGGFSLVGARLGGARLVAVDAGGAVRVRFAVSPRVPFAARADGGWFAPDASGRWLWRGGGAAPRAELGWALSLGPRPIPEAEVRARPGVLCSVLAAAPLHEHCAAPADGGDFDFGSVQDARFGLMGLFRSTQGDALAQRSEFARRSVLLAAPSAAVQTFLRLAVDAREIDPRAHTVRVEASAGTAGLGWTLHRPASDAGAPRFEHWTFDPAGQEDWHAVEPGRCEGTPLADAGAAACSDAWSAALAQRAWRVVLRDAAGAVLHESTLPLSRPVPAATDRVFARWDLASRPEQQPTLAWIHGSTTGAAAGDALWLQWPWRPAAEADIVARQVQFEWQRADPAQPGSAEWVRRVTTLSGEGGVVTLTLPPRAGYLGTWLAARLEAVDAVGTRYWHTVSPANPH